MFQGHFSGFLGDPRGIPESFPFRKSHGGPQGVSEEMRGFLGVCLGGFKYGPGVPWSPSETSL